MPGLDGPPQDLGRFGYVHSLGRFAQAAQGRIRQPGVVGNTGVIGGFKMDEAHLENHNPESHKAQQYDHRAQGNRPQPAPHRGTHEPANQ